MSRDCESCDLSHILKMKKIMCGIKMKSAIFPSHLTHKYTKVVPAHILCVCVCVMLTPTTATALNWSSLMFFQMCWLACG